MELNWSTFTLEIVNFLVLVWLLKRFLYQPVKRIVERRRQEIEARLAEAGHRKREAEDMKERYERRLADWEQEKKKAWETLRREMEAERQRQMATLSEALAEARKKTEVVWEQEKREWRRQAEEQALVLGAKFVTRLLERLADEHLHRRLLALLLEGLTQWPAEESAALRRDFHTTRGEVKVLSAFALDEKDRQRLMEALRVLMDAAVQCQFATDSTLLAGLRIDLGAYVIRANLKDELEFFAHHD